MNKTFFLIFLILLSLNSVASEHLISGSTYSGISKSDSVNSSTNFVLQTSYQRDFFYKNIFMGIETFISLTSPKSSIRLGPIFTYHFDKKNILNSFYTSASVGLRKKENDSYNDYTYYSLRFGKSFKLNEKVAIRTYLYRTSFIYSNETTNTFGIHFLNISVLL